MVEPPAHAEAVAVTAGSATSIMLDELLDGEVDEAIALLDGCHHIAETRCAVSLEGGEAEVEPPPEKYAERTDVGVTAR